jgi:hypothetical protein
LNLPVNKVVETIEKMESVSAAKELLTTLFNKSESSDHSNSLEPKTESVVRVDAPNAQELKAKGESNLKTLRELCMK